MSEVGDHRHSFLARLQGESGRVVEWQKMSRAFGNERQVNATRHVYRNANLSLALMMASPKALVVPALKKHTATVIMAHGLGDRSVGQHHLIWNPSLTN